MRSALLFASILGFALGCKGNGSTSAPTAAAPAPTTAPAGEPPSAKGLAFAFSSWRVNWIGDKNTINITFLPGGKITDKNWPNDVDTYKADDKKVHMEMNSGATIYDGTFVDPETMGGTYFQPEGGAKGAWKAVRVE